MTWSLQPTESLNLSGWALRSNEVAILRIIHIPWDWPLNRLSNDPGDRWAWVFSLSRGSVTAKWWNSDHWECNPYLGWGKMAATHLQTGIHPEAQAVWFLNPPFHWDRWSNVQKYRWSNGSGLLGITWTSHGNQKQQCRLKSKHN